LAVTHIETLLRDTAAGTTSNSAFIPSSGIGDLLLFAVINRDATTVPTVTDNDTTGNTWTRKHSGETSKVTLWYKWATVGSAGKTVTATGATGSCTVICSSIHGSLVAQGDPFDGYSWESNISGNETHAAITPTVNNCLIGFIVGNDSNDTLNPGTYTATSPTTLTEAGESLSTGGSDCSLAIAFGTQTTATSTGAVNWAQTDGTTQTILFAIKPEVTAVATEPTKFFSYSFSNDASDLTGGGQNKQLETSGATAGTWGSLALASGAHALCSMFTNASDPGTDGVSDKTLYVGLNVTTGSASVKYSALAYRVNSSGVVQSTGVTSLETIAAVSGFYWLTLDIPNLGTWASGDRLRVDVKARNTTTGSGVTATVTLASTSVRQSSVSAPWSDATMVLAYGDRPGTITLSGSDLIGTVGASANYNSVRATTQQLKGGSGKVYFEFEWLSFTDSGEEGVGIATRSAALDGSATNNWIGWDANSVGWYPDGGVRGPSGAVNNIQTITTTQTGCVAIDFANSTIWFRTNAGNWNNSGTANPVTNTGGISFSALSGQVLPMMTTGFSGTSVEFNFSGPFAQTPPTGFTKYDGSSTSSSTPISVNATSATSVIFLKVVSKSVSAPAVSTTTVRRAVTKAISASAVTTSTVRKAVTKTVSASCSSAVTAVKSVAKVVSTSVSTTASVFKSVGKTVSASVLTGATVTKEVGKTVAASCVSAVSAFKSVGKTIAATCATAVDVAANTVANTYDVAVNVTCATTASVIKEVSKSLSAAVSTSALVFKEVGKTITTSVGTTGTIFKSVGKTISASCSGSVAFLKDMTKSVTVPAGTTTTAFKAVTKTVSASTTIVTSVSKQVGKSIQATLSSSVSILKAISKTISVSVATTVTFQALKAIIRTINATCTTSVSILADFVAAVADAVDFLIRFRRRRR
jgi:hypothetical protein